MKNLLAWTIIFLIKIIEYRPKPQVVYSGVSYKCDYDYNRHNEDWNDYLRDTGL